MAHHESIYKIFLIFTEVRVLVNEIGNLFVGVSESLIALLIAEWVRLVRHLHKHIRQIFVQLRNGAVCLIDLSQNVVHSNYQ